MANDDDATAGEEPQYDRLTNRSKQVLRLVGQGLTSDQIAHRLRIHPITVNGHVEKARRLLGVRRRLDAARLLALHENGGAPPTIPAQRPATVSAVWRRGFLDIAPGVDCAADPASIEAALSVLREALESLSRNLASENVGERQREVVREAAEGIPQAFPTTGEVFRLGHRHGVLEALADAAGTEWSPSTYSEYAATLLHYERVLKQFPAWQEFLNNALEDNELGDGFPRAAQAAKDLAAGLLGAKPMDFGPLATPGLLAELDQMSDPMSIAEGPDSFANFSWSTLGLIVKDIVESIGNIIKSIAEAAVSYLKIASGGFRREMDKQAELDGAKAFHWLRRAAKLGLLGGGGGALAALIAAHPEQFAWVAKVITFIMRVG